MRFSYILLAKAAFSPRLSLEYKDRQKCGFHPISHTFYQQKAHFGLGLLKCSTQYFDE